MSNPSCGLTWLTVQGRSLRGSLASRMAESVLKIRTSPEGPEPSIRLCPGSEVVITSAILGREQKEKNRRKVSDLIAVCRAPEIPILVVGNSIHLCLTSIMLQISQTARVSSDELTFISSRPGLVGEYSAPSLPRRVSKIDTAAASGPIPDKERGEWAICSGSIVSRDFLK